MIKYKNITGKKFGRLTAFYNWSMANGYEDNLTIDRIDVNGNYEPNNCRWATIKQQNRNRRNTPYYRINNEVKALSEWCETYNIKYHTVYTRLKRGWSICESLELEKHK